MATEKPKTVTMEALEYHTYNGGEYNVGDTYELAEDLVDSVTLQGKAVRTDRVERAREATKAAEKAAKQRGSTAVEPMSTKRGGKALAKTRKARK